MASTISAVVGWGTIALVAGSALWLVVATALRFFRSAPLEKRYGPAGGGIGGAFDAVWSPSAMEAGSERDRQTKRSAPAPSPGDPPWTIDGDRIRIDP